MPLSTRLDENLDIDKLPLSEIAAYIYFISLRLLSDDMEIPTFAKAKAGASLTPPPTIATEV